MPNRNHNRPSIDQIKAVLVRIRNKLNGEDIHELRTPDHEQSSEWREADVVITSYFAWEPQSFADAHDLVVRTHHVGELGRRVDQGNDLGLRCQRAFVVDDISQARGGRKVEGTCCYFDHTEGRTRRGHQVLHLGLAAEKGFLPLEAQIVMGESAASTNPRTNRSRTSAVPPPGICAGRASPPVHQTRPVPGHAPARALRAGFRAAFVLADALVRGQGKHRLLPGKQTDRHFSNETRAINLSLPRTPLHGLPVVWVVSADICTVTHSQNGSFANADWGERGDDGMWPGFQCN
jgi:hypothetical protein